MIGIVGGVGPLAGLDIMRKVIEETAANIEQDHLPILLNSQPHRISEPTAYLIGKETSNPAYAIAEIIMELESAGANVVGVPSHAVHARRIFEVIQEELQRKGSRVKLLHMVQETALYVKERYDHTAVGVLASTDTKNNGLYQHTLTTYGLKALEPEASQQEKIHSAIYDGTYGIRAVSSPVSNRARGEIIKVIAELKKMGAQSVVFGDAAFPLAIPEKESDGLPIIDPNRILARALIATFDATKLRTEESMARL